MLMNGRYFHNVLTVALNGYDTINNITYLGSKMLCNRYGYESHKKLYDIDNINGTKYYKLNCRMIDKPTHIHKQIEKHFNI